MIVEVFQDTVCPWCRIGKKRLFEALQQWEEPVEIRFRAFQLDPDIPGEGLPFRQSMEAKKGGRQVVDQMLNHVTAVGAASGITFRFDRVTYMPNTIASHTLIKAVPPEKTADAVEAVFKAYFEDGLNIGDVDVLAGIAQELGEDPEQVKTQITTNAKKQEIEADLAQARALQITGVPFFVFDGKLGLSGAHPTENFLKAFQQVKSSGR